MRGNLLASAITVDRSLRKLSTSAWRDARMHAGETTAGTSTSRPRNAVGCTYRAHGGDRGRLRHGCRARHRQITRNRSNSYRRGCRACLGQRRYNSGDRTVGLRPRWSCGVPPPSASLARAYGARLLRVLAGSVEAKAVPSQRRRGGERRRDHRGDPRAGEGAWVMGPLACRVPRSTTCSIAVALSASASRLRHATRALAIAWVPSLNANSAANGNPRSGQRSGSRTPSACTTGSCLPAFQRT